MLTPWDEFCRRHVPAVGPALVAGSRMYDKPDRRALYRQALGVDMLPGPGVDFVADLEETDIRETCGPFAHVDCVSVLEHCRRPWLVAANLERCLVPGGTILISVPFVWRIHAYPSDYFRFTPEGVASLFEHIAWAEIAMGNYRLQHKSRLPAVAVKGHPYMSRTEVFAFGTKQ